MSSYQRFVRLLQSVSSDFTVRFLVRSLIPIMFLFIISPNVYAELLECGPNTGAEAGASSPIPGDPDNLKGWIVHTQKDDAGNKLTLWCIETSKGVGNSYGYRYIPFDPAKPVVWLGRCAFVGGENVFSKEPTGDTNRNGTPDQWTTITWTSEDDGGGGATDSTDDDGQPGKKDFDWEYDVASNVLRRWETLNGNRVRPNTPDYQGPPPENFDQLMTTTPNPNQDDAMASAPVIDVELMGHNGISWEYALTGNGLTEFSPTLIMTGDAWSLAATGIIDARAPNGWSVLWYEDYVTWTYNELNDIILGGNTLYGFELDSWGVQGTINWLSDSFDDSIANFGYAGEVMGPSIPVPPVSLLLAAGIFAAAIPGVIRRQR